MKTRSVVVLLLCLLFVLPACFASGFTFTVTPSFAPNAFGSPSWSAYVANANYALQHGLSSYGTPGTPSYYTTAGYLTDLDNIVTSFNSWDGAANPTGAYANELGNRLHFGLTISNPDQMFSLSELSFDMSSTDPGNIFGFTGNFDASDNYSLSRVGIIFGSGGDTFITSGSASQMVNELVYVGVGNALATGDVSCPGTGQQAINCVANYYDSIMPLSITTTYTLTDSSNTVLGSGSATVSSVPEPASILLFGSGLAALAGVVRRRMR